MHRVNLVIHVAIGSLIGIGQPLYSGFTPKSNRQFRAALAAMPALAQAAPTSAGVYRVGAGVTPPSINSKTEPRYTDEARRLHMNAIVVLSLIVEMMALRGTLSCGGQSASDSTRKPLRLSKRDASSLGSERASLSTYLPPSR